MHQTKPNLSIFLGIQQSGSKKRAWLLVTPTVRHPVGYNPDLSVRLLHVVRSIFFWYNWAALYNIWTKDYLNYSRHMTQTTVISELDRFKLQKKRERNRIAASKCRQRKLERISDLGNPDDSNCSKKNFNMRSSHFRFQKVKWRSWREKMILLWDCRTVSILT